MKKLIMSLIAALFITLIVPLVIVEIFAPSENANSSNTSSEQQTQEVSE